MASRISQRIRRQQNERRSRTGWSCPPPQPPAPRLPDPRPTSEIMAVVTPGDHPLQAGCGHLAENEQGLSTSCGHTPGRPRGQSAYRFPESENEHELMHRLSLRATRRQPAHMVLFTCAVSWYLLIFPPLISKRK